MKRCGWALEWLVISTRSTKISGIGKMPADMEDATYLESNGIHFTQIRQQQLLHKRSKKNKKKKIRRISLRLCYRNGRKFIHIQPKKVGLVPLRTAEALNLSAVIIIIHYSTHFPYQRSKRSKDNLGSFFISNDDEVREKCCGWMFRWSPVKNNRRMRMMFEKVVLNDSIMIMNADDDDDHYHHARVLPSSPPRSGS